MKQIILIGLCAALWFGVWRALFGPQGSRLQSLWLFLRTHGIGFRKDVAHVPLSTWFVPFVLLFSLPVALHFSGNTACSAGMSGSCALQAIALAVWALTLAVMIRLWSGQRREPMPEEQDAMWNAPVEMTQTQKAVGACLAFTLVLAVPLSIGILFLFTLLSLI